MGKHHLEKKEPHAARPPFRLFGVGTAPSLHLLFGNNYSINFISLLVSVISLMSGKVLSNYCRSFQMKTKINLYRETRCSLFLSISICLFTGTGLTNRDFTRLAKALWSH